MQHPLVYFSKDERITGFGAGKAQFRMLFPEIDPDPQRQLPAVVEFAGASNPTSWLSLISRSSALPGATRASASCFSRVGQRCWTGRLVMTVHPFSIPWRIRRDGRGWGPFRRAVCGEGCETEREPRSIATVIPPQPDSASARLRVGGPGATREPAETRKRERRPRECILRRVGHPPERLPQVHCRYRAPSRRSLDPIIGYRGEDEPDGDEDEAEGQTNDFQTSHLLTSRDYMRKPRVTFAPASQAQPRLAIPLTECS